MVSRDWRQRICHVHALALGVPLQGKHGLLRPCWRILGLLRVANVGGAGLYVMSYALENRKAYAIMVFWVIFNPGAVIGSIIPLVQNFLLADFDVNAVTYVAQLVLMAAGIELVACMFPIDRVGRSYGSRASAMPFYLSVCRLSGTAGSSFSSALHASQSEPRGSSNSLTTQTSSPCLSKYATALSTRCSSSSSSGCSDRCPTA